MYCFFYCLLYPRTEYIMKYGAVRKFYRDKRYQETGMEYFTILQMIMKDDREKAIAWRSVSRKMTCYHVSEKKQLRLSVCVLYPVCSLRSAVCSLHSVASQHFVPGLQSAFCINCIPSPPLPLTDCKSKLLELWVMSSAAKINSKQKNECEGGGFNIGENLSTGV